MSNIVLMVAVIKNSYKAWDEEHGIENDKGEEQVLDQRPQKTFKTKFTNRVTCQGGVLMGFSPTTQYVQVGGPYYKKI